MPDGMAASTLFVSHSNSVIREGRQACGIHRPISLSNKCTSLISHGLYACLQGQLMYAYCVTWPLVSAQRGAKIALLGAFSICAANSDSSP